MKPLSSDGTSTPTVSERPLRRPRATPFTRKPSSSAACLIAVAFSGRTGAPLKCFEIVDSDRPVARWMSL